MTLKYALILASIVGAFFIGREMAPDPNAYPTFGTTGYPKNCRAIVMVNVDGVESKQYTPEEALSSIARNCGRHGQSWGQ